MKLHLLAACFSTTVLALSGGTALAQDAKSNVTVVLAETVDVVEPCMAARQDVGRVISENVNEMLVEFDYVNGGLKPRLATEWSKIDDDTWEFKLRPNVKWHDGKPFTAKDVQFTIERNKNKKLSCETGGKYFGGTEFSFETPDANTIRITTKPAQPILPLLMTVMAVEPADATPADEFTRKPIGTGPYTFDKWDIGQSIVLKRNPEYWGKSRRSNRRPICSAPTAPLLPPWSMPAKPISFRPSPYRMPPTRKPISPTRIRRRHRCASIRAQHPSTTGASAKR